MRKQGRKIRQSALKQFENGMPLETRRKLGKPIVQLSLEFEFISEYSTAKEAAKSTGANNTHLCSVCKGDRNTSGGYRWMHLEDYRNIEIRKELIDKQIKKRGNAKRRN